jgi:hypothetical protein
MIAILSPAREGGSSRADSRAVRQQPRERAGLPRLCLDGGPAPEGTPEGEDEVLVITRWRSWEAFDAGVGSEEFCTPSALAVSRLTVTAVQ